MSHVGPVSMLGDSLSGLGAAQWDKLSQLQLTKRPDCTTLANVVLPQKDRLSLLLPRRLANTPPKQAQKEAAVNGATKLLQGVKGKA
jgi:hypothetical protein